MQHIIIVLIFFIIGVIWSYKKYSTLVCLVFKSGYRFLNNPDTALELLGTFHDAYPAIFKLPLSFRRCYFISKPEYFEKVLSSPHSTDRPEVYSYLQELLGPNIFTASGSIWKKSRKALSPSFSQRSVDSHLRVFFQQAENLAVNIAKQSKKDLDVVGLTSSCFINAIFESLLGVKYELDIAIVRRDVDRLLLCTARRGISWHYQPTAFMPSFLKLCQKNLQYGQVVGKSLICEKRKHLEASKEAINRNGPLTKDSDAKPTCTIEHLLEHAQFTDERTLSELLLLVVAGFETSTSSLLFIFVALALHPNIQERLYEDIVNICGTEGPVTVEDLSRIEYADRVIKESLRLFPVVPVIGRYTQENLDIGNKVLPKNSALFLNVIHTHRNQKYWRDPLVYDPERFSQECISKIYPFSYIPFSYGIRNCIGFRYAMVSLKMTLVTVMRKVKILTDYKSIEEIKLKSHFTLRPRDGYKLWFEARN